MLKQCWWVVADFCDQTSDIGNFANLFFVDLLSEDVLTFAQDSVRTHVSLAIEATELCFSHPRIVWPGLFRSSRGKLCS